MLQSVLQSSNINASARMFGQSQVNKSANSVQTGKNVGKVRWLEDDRPVLVPNYDAEEYLIAGSCGVPSDNEIQLWKFAIQDIGLALDDTTGDERVAKMQLADSTKITGEVTGMTTLDADKFAVVTSIGSFTIFGTKLDQNGRPTEIMKIHSKDDLHHSESNNKTHQRVCHPATCVVAKNMTAVSVGEDGSIYQICADTLKCLRSLQNVDPLSIYTAAFTGSSEVLTGNSAGQLKVWDLKSGSKKPVATMNANMLLNNLYGVSCIATHPSQNHAVIVGYQSGCMDLWDIRMGSGCQPAANLISQSQAGSISEIYFHRNNPDNFFTCSQSGELCHWLPSGASSMEVGLGVFEADLNIEFLKCGVDFKELYASSFPLNSMSISKNGRIACGGDSGIVHCLEI